MLLVFNIKEEKTERNVLPVMGNAFSDVHNNASICAVAHVPQCICP